LFYSTCFIPVVLFQLFYSTCFIPLVLFHLFYSTCFIPIVIIIPVIFFQLFFSRYFFSVIPFQGFYSGCFIPVGNNRMRSVSISGRSSPVQTRVICTKDLVSAAVYCRTTCSSVLTPRSKLRKTERVTSLLDQVSTFVLTRRISCCCTNWQKKNLPSILIGT